jgi:integrase
MAADGRRLDRHGAGRVVRKVARRAGIGKAVTPHTLRHAFITAARLDAGVPLRDVQRPPHMLTRERRCGTTAPAAAWTGTRPTSSPPTSQAPHGKGVPAGRCSA